jgi:ribosomal protein S18 acetylase RimI-like enzyme
MDWLGQPLLVGARGEVLNVSWSSDPRPLNSMLLTVTPRDIRFCEQRVDVKMVTVQRAKVEEVQEIKRVLNETWLDTYGSFLSPNTIEQATSVWHNPERLASQIQNPNAYFGVAKDKEKTILGLVTARKQDDDTVVIDRLYVTPQYQRRGIGSMLLEESITTFPGIARLILEVEEQNKVGLSFYQKQGFREISRKEVRVEDDILLVIEMEKEFS